MIMPLKPTACVVQASYIMVNNRTKWFYNPYENKEVIGQVMSVIASAGPDHYATNLCLEAFEGMVNFKIQNV